MKTARKHHCVLHERNSSQQTLLPGHSWRRRLWLGVRATELATGTRSPGARGTAARHCRGRSFPTPQGWTRPLAGQGQRLRRPLDLARPRSGGPSSLTAGRAEIARDVRGSPTAAKRALHRWSSPVVGEMRRAREVEGRPPGRSPWDNDGGSEMCCWWKRKEKKRTGTCVKSGRWVIL
jgi:hypothetical protein